DETRGEGIDPWESVGMRSPPRAGPPWLACWCTSVFPLPLPTMRKVTYNSRDNPLLHPAMLVPAVLTDVHHCITLCPYCRHAPPRCRQPAKDGMLPILCTYL